MGVFRPFTVFVAWTSLLQVGRAWAPQLPECLDQFQPFVYAGCYLDNVNGSLTLPFRVTLPDSNNATIEECAAECKGNGYRYAGLEYYQECYCGATVAGPQTDDSACNLPCTGNSSEICGGNNILSVYEDTTFEPLNTSTIADYVYLSCWTDDSDQGRALVWPQDQLDSSAMTPELCLQACKDSGYPFAGTEYGGQCWCGVVLGNGTAAASESDCNSACNGDSSETCGGSARLSLYVASDLESLQPCEHNSLTSSSSSASSTTSTSSSSSFWPSTTSSSTASTTSTISSSSSSSSFSSTTCISTTPSTVKTSSVPLTTPCTTSTTSTIKTTSSKTTSSCYTTTTIPSTCEYGCGSWCSNSLPPWSDQISCLTAHAQCLLQVTSCFTHAGWPGVAQCFSFSSWCSSIGSYCSSSSCSGHGGTCNKGDCFGKSPPSGGKPGSTVSSAIPCTTTTTSTSTKKTTSSTSPTSCLVPTATSLCKQPSNARWGYGEGSPVGGIALPCLTCNDLRSDWQAGNWFKLYDEAESAKCASYPRGGVPMGCKDACQRQYSNCVGVYAKGCMTGVYKTDSYLGATQKCAAQLADCESLNAGVEGSGKCGSWCGGW